jgi:hypothetical protein
MAIRTKEEEIADFVKIYIKANDSREKIAQRLRKAYKKEEDVKFGLAVYDKLVKEMNIKTTEVKSKKIYLIAVVFFFFSLIVFAVVAYYLFFDESVFSENFCSNEGVSIKLIGQLNFRKKIAEELRFLSENDCESFLLVAKNVNSIKFENNVIGKFNFNEKQLITGSTVSPNFWYAAFFVKGACMFQGIEMEKDENISNLELECWLKTADVMEKVFHDENLAIHLRLKPVSSDWTEFRFYD